MAVGHAQYSSTEINETNPITDSIDVSNEEFPSSQPTLHFLAKLKESKNNGRIGKFMAH